MVISELVGRAKPDPSIFAHTFDLLGEPEKSKVLMVGDTPASDILEPTALASTAAGYNIRDKAALSILSPRML